MIELFALTGADVGRSFQVDAGARLGRGEQCEVSLRDRSVSRTHARLERDAYGCWWIVDAGSRNGVFVAGERVQRAPLADQTEFQLGELCLRVRIEIPGEGRSSEPGTLPPAAGPIREKEPGEEIELESPDEIELVPLSSAPPRTPAAEPRARFGETTLVRSAPVRLRNAERSGWLATDLSQIVFWQRLLLYGIAALSAALIGYLAWRATAFLRSQATPGAGAAAADEQEN